MALALDAGDAAMAESAAPYVISGERNLLDVEELSSNMKRLRSDLADNETAYKTAGHPIKIETFACPHCGGTLELGMDKCEYCGQVILS